MALPLTALQVRIMQYVSTHAHAAEAPEGITRIWLDLDDSVDNVAAVLNALLQLADSGLLEQFRLPGGGVVFRQRIERPAESPFAGERTRTRHNGHGQ